MTASWGVYLELPDILSQQFAKKYSFSDAVSRPMELVA